MTSRRAATILVGLSALVGTAAAPAAAQVAAAAPSQGEPVRVMVGANITFDPGLGVYTYSYRVINAVPGAAEVWKFALDIAGTITDTTAPVGWTSTIDEDRGVVSWVATEPPKDPDDERAAESPHQIKPGETLGGYSFQSHDPPGPARFRAFGPSGPPPAAEHREESAKALRAAEGMTLAPRRPPLAPIPGALTTYAAPRD